VEPSGQWPAMRSGSDSQRTAGEFGSSAAARRAVPGNSNAAAVAVMSHSDFGG